MKREVTGEEFKQLLKDGECSQKEAAKILGVSVRTIQRFQREGCSRFVYAGLYLVIGERYYEQQN